MYVSSMLIFAGMPFGFGIVSVCFWKILSVTCMRQSLKDSYLRNSQTTVNIFIFLLYPTICSYAFGMFNCYSIEDVSYLQSDFSIVCWSENHKKLIIYYTLPVIIVWVIGYPFAIFTLLYRQRKNLNDNDNIIKYGLYYIGLKDETFYW